MAISDHNMNQEEEHVKFHINTLFSECNETEYVFYKDCSKYIPYPELHFKILFPNSLVENITKTVCNLCFLR